MSVRKILAEAEQLVAQLEAQAGLTPAVEGQLQPAGEALVGLLQQFVAQLPSLSPAGKMWYTLAKPLFQQLLPLVNQWQNQGVQGNSWLAYQAAGEWTEVFAWRGFDQAVQTRPEITHFLVGLQVQISHSAPPQKGEVWVGLEQIELYIQGQLVWQRPVGKESAAGEISLDIIRQLTPLFEKL